MSQIGHALLLLGSPRALDKSTSYSLGAYLLRALDEKGVETSFIHIQRSLRSQERTSKLLASFGRADLVILSCPVYVDSLPSPVVRWMEMLAEDAELPRDKDKAFAAIVNCGFPESRHNEVALRICRRFAKEIGMRWQGGLGLGGGEAIAGRPLQEAGGLGRNVRQSLQLSAQFLAEGQHIPDEAMELMSKPVIPAWLYRWIGDRGWKRKAKRYGTLKKLMDRPFR